VVTCSVLPSREPRLGHHSAMPAHDTVLLALGDAGTDLASAYIVSIAAEYAGGSGVGTPCAWHTGSSQIALEPALDSGHFTAELAKHATTRGTADGEAVCLVPRLVCVPSGGSEHSAMAGGDTPDRGPNRHSMRLWDTTWAAARSDARLADWALTSCESLVRRSGCDGGNCVFHVLADVFAPSSGLLPVLLPQLADTYPGATLLITPLCAPSPALATSHGSPQSSAAAAYASLMTWSAIAEHSSLTVALDTTALGDAAGASDLAASILAGVTAAHRFPQHGCSLQQLATSLVPFPRLHVAFPSTAPLARIPTGDGHGAVTPRHAPGGALWTARLACTSIMRHLHDPRHLLFGPVQAAKHWTSPASASAGHGVLARRTLAQSAVLRMDPDPWCGSWPADIMYTWPHDGGDAGDAHVPRTLFTAPLLPRVAAAVTGVGLTNTAAVAHMLAAHAAAAQQALHRGVALHALLADGMSHAEVGDALADVSAWGDEYAEVGGGGRDGGGRVDVATPLAGGASHTGNGDVRTPASGREASRGGDTGWSTRSLAGSFGMASC
jgi:hypothetical protein